MAETKRRRHGEDAIYLDAAKNRYYGAVSLGHDADGRRIRRKVSDKSKQEVRDKLKRLHADLDVEVQSPATDTVSACVEDWLSEGLSGRSERTRTICRDGVKLLTDSDWLEAAPRADRARCPVCVSGTERPAVDAVVADRA